MPDSLTPPKGATSEEMKPVLMPTIPYSSASATRHVRSRSLRVEVRREAVGRVVRDRDRLRVGREAVDARDRAERLLAAHRHVHRHAREHRRLEELALDPAAAEDELGALRERVGDVPLDLRDGRLVDQRPDLRALGEAVRDLERRDGLGERADEVVVDRRPGRESGWPRCRSGPSSGTCTSSRPPRPRRGRRRRRR